MKKKIYNLLFVMGVSLIFVAGIYIILNLIRIKMFLPKTKKAGYELCFNGEVIRKEIPAWVSNSCFNVLFVDNANDYSLALMFPAIKVTSPIVTHWVHIVTTTGKQQFSGINSSIIDSPWNWIFVDVSHESRNSSDPFFSTGTLFQDNPSWNIPLHRELDWTGEIYGLVEDEGNFYPAGGISWGII